MTSLHSPQLLSQAARLPASSAMLASVMYRLDRGPLGLLASSRACKMQGSIGGMCTCNVMPFGRHDRRFQF
jgi:hypothetical protein